MESANELGWNLEAWAVFSNHFHFVGKSGSGSARWVNLRDKVPGRKVWHNYWDTPLTFEESCDARLAYVHGNAVKHGLVHRADQYPWCSASWFENNATPAQVAMIQGIKTDRLRMDDDFGVARPP